MVADATSKDANLQAVIHAISNSWKVSNAHNLKPFYSFRDELSTKICSTDSHKSTIICKSDLVLIPPALVPQVLEQLHEGHIGSKKMKQMLQACKLSGQGLVKMWTIMFVDAMLVQFIRLKVTALLFRLLLN